MNRMALNLVWSLTKAWPWLLIFVVSAVLLSLRTTYPAIVTFPETWTIPLSDWINLFMDWFVPRFQWLFRSISGSLSVVFQGIQALLVGAPWGVPLAMFTLIAWQGGGTKLALLVAGALFYILISGYWAEAMNTLALVALALPLAVLLGFVLGYLGVKSDRARRVILPTLDLMQTIPAFAYLIPILLLFGFGPVVGLIASVVFAIPPMVRNTILGFQNIPPAILESAEMSGCTPRQRFFWAELPTSLPQVLIGVNQTTMATLSMVIIAAIIGGFEDIGWEVLSAMRKAQFGQSLLAGIVIVLLAIMLDRVTSAYAARQLPTASFAGFPLSRFVIALIACLIIGFALPLLAPVFGAWPDALVFFPAQPINGAVEDFVAAYGRHMAAFKNALLYYVLLPVKLGFERTIVPFTWGTEFTPAMKATYWALTGFGVLATFARGYWKTGIAVVVVLGTLYYGVTGLPWLSVFLMVVLLGYSVAGRGLALFSAGTIVFLWVNGLWPQAMLSVYLCFVAVFLCILFGGLIGIWAATSETLSAVVRPINDMLQTLPQFVLLIPALMLFQVGDFTALLAIVAYAIVPMIRYTEFGLRNVAPTLIDAGVSCGLSAWQLFWQVRLPLAIPQILVGINQTVLYALGMLVIAALVGTTGLGQAIYVALGVANAGDGIIAGLGMALIAMTIDRTLQAVIRQRV